MGNGRHCRSVMLVVFGLLGPVTPSLSPRRTLTVSASDCGVGSATGRKTPLGRE